MPQFLGLLNDVSVEETCLLFEKTAVKGSTGLKDGRGLELGRGLSWKGQGEAMKPVALGHENQETNREGHLVQGYSFTSSGGPTHR